MSPLFYAIRSNNQEVIKFLLDVLKVNLEHQDIQNRTPFYYACSLGDLPLVKMLYQYGANINALTSLKRTPFSKSSFLGLFSIVQFLLTLPELDMNRGDSQGRNALHNAAFGPRGGRDGKKIGTWDRDSPEITQLLLEHGMDVEGQDKDNNSPLHVAASSEALDSIPVLIAFGGDLNRQNKWGETPLMVAAKFGHIETAKLFVESYGADLLAENKEGHNAFEVSAKNNQLEIYEYLLNKMRTVLIEIQKINKYKCFEVLVKLMQMTKKLTENEFIKIYVRLLKDYIVVDDIKEVLTLVAQMKDCQELLLKTLINERMDSLSCLNHLFEFGLKQKNLKLFFCL